MQTTRLIFSPFDRTPTERKREMASIGSDMIGGRINDREIRESFRVSRFGK